MAKHYKIALICVPGHQNMDGNCIEDELAMKGTTIEILQEKDAIGMPIATCRLLIKQKTQRQAELRWKNATNCEIYKQTWPCQNLKRTKKILRKSDVKTFIKALSNRHTCVKNGS